MHAFENGAINCLCHMTHRVQGEVLVSDKGFRKLIPIQHINLVSETEINGHPYTVIFMEDEYSKVATNYMTTMPYDDVIKSIMRAYELKYDEADQDD